MAYRLGIDLGTTSTAAAIRPRGSGADRIAERAAGRAEAVPLGTRSPAVPTVVLARPDGVTLVGEAAERRAHEHPDRVAREFKRRVGDTVPLLLGGAPYSAPALMAIVFGWVISRATELNGEPPDHVTVTHPANWGRFKVDALSGAFIAAGLPEPELLTEPQAAAIHVADSERIEPGQTVAVFDLGGGTFDAAVLRRTATGFEPVGAPEGIENLGGIDFDEAVLGHVRRALGNRVSALDDADPATLLALRRAAVDAKEGLSEDVDAVVPVRLGGVSHDVLIRRSEFEEMIRPALVLTVDCLERTIARAGLSATDLAAVVLSGGSSRIPLVRELVGERLGRPVTTTYQPQLAVALGAAAHEPVPASTTGRPPAVPTPAAPALAVPPPEPAARAAATVTARIVEAGTVEMGTVEMGTVESGPVETGPVVRYGANLRGQGPAARLTRAALAVGLLVGLTTGAILWLAGR